MWMAKLIAAALVVLAGAGLGARRGAQLTCRRQALQDALLLLRLVRLRLDGGDGLWLPVLTAVARQADFAVLRLPEKWPAADTLVDTLHQGFAAAQLPQLLGVRAASLLEQALVCAVTKEETASRLEYYQNLLQQELAEARRKEETDRPLQLRLGWLGGLLLALILW